MDRASFLSCLPFLSSESFSSWPPPQACAKQNAFDGGNGDAPLLLLENYLLSIEPRSSNDEAATLGPACFASPTATVATVADDNGMEGDSSICQFHMAISPPSNSDNHIHHNKSSSPGSVSTNGTSTTTSQSPKTPSRNSGAVFLRPAAATTKVFVRVENKHCFRVDLRQLEKMQLLLVPHQNDEITTTQPQQQRPPCLLLMFEICCFRIFSLKKDGGIAHKELESVYNCLQACVEDLAFHREGAHGMYYPIDWANSFGASSGSNSAGHGSSSNEAGQGHTTTATTSTRVHGDVTAMPDSHDNIDGGGGAQQRNSQVSKQPILQKFDDDKALALVLQQRQACFLKSREGLQSLNTVLDMPAWIWERGGESKRRRLLAENHGGDDDDDDDDEVNVLREHLNDSLTSTADHLSGSYWVSRHEKNQAVHFYETQLQGYQHEMDQLLSEAFPRIHRGRWPAVASSSSITTPARAAAAATSTTTSPDGKRRKPTSQPETPSMTTQDTVHHGSGTQSSSSSSRWLFQAKETMKRQRQAIEARHRLSLLPMRK